MKTMEDLQLPDAEAVVIWDGTLLAIEMLDELAPRYRWSNGLEGRLFGMLRPEWNFRPGPGEMPVTVEFGDLIVCFGDRVVVVPFELVGGAS